MGKLSINLQQAVSGHYPLISIESYDEDWVLREIKAFAKKQPGEPRVKIWRSTTGFAELQEDDVQVSARADPLQAIREISQQHEPQLSVFLDLQSDLSDARLERAVRDFDQLKRGHAGHHLIMLSSSARLPQSLARLTWQIDALHPDIEALQQLVRRKTADFSLSDDDTRDLIFTLQGLSLTEAEHALSQALSEAGADTDALIQGAHTAKKARVQGFGGLEYVTERRDMHDVGGLHGLKKWIEARKSLYRKAGSASDLPLPKGILIMGISGCGKSLTAKVLSQQWALPLFRLDMNQVFSGAMGNPEATFTEALKTVEAVAPALLWIDEIENGLGYTESGQAEHSHILSAFLTWMQEKPENIFVAATANRIEALPAEMIRKGRFDQVFFCDLPSQDEREEILAIHILSNGADPDTFDIAWLARETDSWNGAEIEQAIIAARIESKREGGFNTDDVLDQIEKIVPLSRTMSEQIKRIRDWAWDRATPASGGLSASFKFDEE
ncbi:MAG: AAA family ATPase [gamma proteobacterium symbiont of Bathyaustriella thionipta]|nr:AAA family ATPase [gamma proteobacterium symbiont of Bathyaustriella thionipta]